MDASFHLSSIFYQFEKLFLSCFSITGLLVTHFFIFLAFLKRSSLYHYSCFDRYFVVGYRNRGCQPFSSRPLRCSVVFAYPSLTRSLLWFFSCSLCLPPGGSAQPWAPSEHLWERVFRVCSVFYCVCTTLEFLSVMLAHTLPLNTY